VTQPKNEWGPDVEELTRFARWAATGHPSPTPRLNAALSAFQGELPTFTPEDQRLVKIDTNPDPKKHYSYSYVTLAKILDKVGPLMAKHGLSFSSMPTYADPGDGKVALCLVYTLAHASGEQRSGVFPLKHEGSIQSLGGVITYARRYCQGAALGIAAEQDDDAMAAMIDSGSEPASVRAPSRSRQAPARTNRPAARAATPAAADALPGGDPAADVDPEIRNRRLRNHMFATLTEAKVPTDRDGRLTWLSDAIGRELTTSGDMTEAEIQTAVDKAKAEIDGSTGEEDAG
jgi:hypothetical protein